MAKLTHEGQSVEVKDGDAIKKAAEEMGVPFGCEDGVCGSCLIEVAEGADNLGPMSQAEKDYGLPDGHRLACQAKVKKGEVKIKF